MRARRTAIVGLILALALAFLFLVPVIAYSTPINWSGCPPSGCPYMYGSVSYWAFGVGATVRGTRAYSLEVATAPSAIRTASSTSYTVSNTSVSCIVSAEGTGFYVTVLSDSGQPIEGAQVSAVRVTSTSGGTCTQTVSSLLTNSTGSVLITPNIGSYYLLTIQYQGKTFSTHAPIDPMQTTYVLLKLPSGSISISEVPFGGCQRTSNSTMCPV